MSEIRTITLGGKAFAVPPLPLRANRVVYPLCRKLTAAGVIERCIEAEGSLDCTTDEIDDLAEIIYQSITTGLIPPSRDEFNALPIEPGELLDAFFAIRYQTGGWISAPAQPDKDPPAGEAKGPARPRTNRRK